MKLEVYNPSLQQPLPPAQWNYEELKQWLESGLASYKGRVYTKETIADAKSDRAALNKLAASIDTKRKEMKAYYLAPIVEVEAQAKELVGLIKACSDEIDAQVKGFDEVRKTEKLEKIKAEIYAPMIGKLAELVPYERLHNPKWLNVTFNMNNIAEELSRRIGGIMAGLTSIDKLGLEPEMAERIKSVYLKDFDLAAAIAERERIEKEHERLERFKEAQEAQEARRVLDVGKDPDAFAKAQPGDIVRFGGSGCISAGVDERPAARIEKPAEVEKTASEAVIELDFRVWLTRTQMLELKDYFNARGIKFGRVPRYE